MAQILTKMTLFYPTLKLSKELIAVWHEMFKKADPVKFHNVFMKVIKNTNNSFFPTPGQIQTELNAESLAERPALLAPVLKMEPPPSPEALMQNKALVENLLQRIRCSLSEKRAQSRPRMPQKKAQGGYSEDLEQ